MRHAPEWSSGINDVELEHAIQTMKAFASESLHGLSEGNKRVLHETQLSAAMAQQGLCTYSCSEMVKKPASGAERRCEVNWHPSKTGTKRFGWSGTGPEA